MAAREILALFGIEVDDKELKAAVSKLDEFVEKVKGVATTLGAAFLVREAYQFVTAMTEEADALAKQAKAMGLSLREMQEWQYAASMQGVSAEQLNGVLNKLGSGKFDKGLAQLGVTSKKADGSMKSSTEVLGDVADALQKIDDPAERNRKAVAVLGRSYTKLLPLLENGREGINELRQEFEDLGGGYTDDFAAKADELGDNIDRLKHIWKAFTIYLVSAVLPAFVTLSQRLVTTAKPLFQFLRNTKVLEAGLIGLAVRGVVFLSGKIGPLGKALRLLSGQFFKVVLPLLILEDFLVFLAGGDSVIGKLANKVGEIFGVENGAREFRLWIDKVMTEVKAFFRIMKWAPQQAKEDFSIFVKGVGKDLLSLGPGTSAAFLLIVESWSLLMDFMLGGWSKTMGLLQVGAQIAELSIASSFHDLKYTLMVIAGHIQDSFAEAWNGIVEGAQDALGVVGKVASALPGSAGSKIEEAIRNLNTARAQGGNADRALGAASAGRAQLDADAALASARWKMLRGGPQVDPRLLDQSNNPTVVNINVPPGTPADQARRIGDAAEKGVNKAEYKKTREARAALIKGG